MTGGYSGPAGPATAILTVNPGALTHFSLTSDNYTQQVTVAFEVEISAYDAFDNLVPADNITVTLTSNPPVMAFDGNGNGVYGTHGGQSDEHANRR